MAASPIQPPEFEVADLREFRAHSFDHLLDEQLRFWADSYRWDFAPSRDVILRFIDAHSLYGCVLLWAGRPVGYSYFIYEGYKALVGDLFVTAAHRCQAVERLLLNRTLESAAAFPGVRRIEGQLLALSFSPKGETILGRPLKIFERLFMLADKLGVVQLPADKGSVVSYRLWQDRDLDQSAELIARCYEGHVDSLINDQYRSVGGARRFLFNSTQHPGGGVFFRSAAWAAVDPLTDRLSGLCLGNLVEAAVGHITQLCVAPHLRRRGVASDLMMLSMEAFRRHDCRALSLTVTSSNREAVVLYERLGFRVARKFAAFIWEAA